MLIQKWNHTKIIKRFKSEAHNAYTEGITQIPLSKDYDKKLQTLDRITSYPYGINVGKVSKTEVLSKFND